MLTEQEQFWKGDFGASYTARNRVDWRARVPFWRDILNCTGAKSILEVGCNAGWNLRALREVDPMLALWGVDVNNDALDEARADGLSVTSMSVTGEWLIEPASFDLVFTAGCLIHIGQQEIQTAMQRIAGTSREHVLAVEYAADQEEPVEYRGHSERLWRRPFGKLYEGFGLKMVKTGEVGKEHGFDQCAYWLLERPA